MSAQTAKLEYARNLNYGESVARVPAAEPHVRRPIVPVTRERIAAAGAAAKSTFGISLFALVGAVFIGVLMIFVVLAQISYNEITNQTVKLQSRLTELSEQERRLEIAHAGVFDMTAVERYAKDVLGMAKPESDQVMILQTAAADKAVIIEDGEEENTILGLGSFLSSLLEYFK